MPKYINSDDIARLAKEINIHDKCKVVHDNEFELSVVGWFLDLHNEINRKSQELVEIKKPSNNKQRTPCKHKSGGFLNYMGTHYTCQFCGCDMDDNV